MTYPTLNSFSLMSLFFTFFSWNGSKYIWGQTYNKLTPSFTSEESSCSWRRQPPFEADSIWMAKEKEAFTSPHTPRFILTTLTRSAISKINKLPALPDGSICFSNLATSHYINKTPPLPPCIKNSPCSTIINTQSIASYCFKQAVNLATKVSLGVQTQAK